MLHLIVAGSILGFAYIHSPSKRWGQEQATAGAIQASMVSAIPLPPRQPVNEKNVLASETPSPAPVTETVKTQPPPKPDEVLIPKKDAKPVKTAEKATPEPPKHPQPTPPVPPNRATTGETSGMRIAQSTMQLRNGTASVSVDDKTFGARFAYYINIVNRTVAQQWFTQEADPRLSNGKRVTIVFDINRAGNPLNPRVQAPSGSPSLDTSALRAVQRVEGFGPLPAGDHITVEYSFDYKLQ
ncbi:MAG TPA: TonB family protein [Granulicella sp.]